MKNFYQHFFGGVFMLFTFFLFSRSVFSQEVQAIIMDVADVETELKLKTEGILISLKDFWWSESKHPGATKRIRASYNLYLSFDQLKTILIDKKGKTKIELNNGNTVEGQIGWFSEARLSGTSNFGELELRMNKIKSITIKSSVSKKPTSMKGRNGIIELRDGSKIDVKNITRLYSISSPYVDVTSTDYSDTNFWITHKRGEAELRTKIPFEKIKEIVFFDNCAQFSIILLDGTELSGSYGGYGNERQEEGIDGIYGQSILGEVRLRGSCLGCGIKSIKFIE